MLRKIDKINAPPVPQSSKRKKKKKCEEVSVEECGIRNPNIGEGCKYGGSARRLCDNNECPVCFWRSFACSVRAKNWNEINGLTPRQVLKGVHRKFWFNCDKSEHEFDSDLHNVIAGYWCPYPCCSETPKKLCDNDECEICYEHSFASSDKAKYWSERNTLTPRHVFKNSPKKFWFKCDKCPHEFQQSPHMISSNGNWCMYCSKTNKKLCCDENCQFCLLNSFSSSDKAKFWSQKNKLSPREVLKNSPKKYWFDCPECRQDFQITLQNASRGHWCPTCKKKTERKLKRLLLDSFPDTSYQHSFDWCRKQKTGKPYVFDFYIPSLKVIIELDGDQHFKQVLNWDSPEDNRESDVIKMSKANEHGISVIRLYQPEVYSNSWNYEEFVQILTKERKEPTREFITETNLYDLW
jgi:very-short-patch-repair endonuclease